MVSWSSLIKCDAMTRQTAKFSSVLGSACNAGVNPEHDTGSSGLAQQAMAVQAEKCLVWNGRKLKAC